MGTYPSCARCFSPKKIADQTCAFCGPDPTASPPAGPGRSPSRGPTEPPSATVAVAGGAGAGVISSLARLRGDATGATSNGSASESHVDSAVGWAPAGTLRYFPGIVGDLCLNRPPLPPSPPPAAEGPEAHPDASFGLLAAPGARPAPPVPLPSIDPPAAVSAPPPFFRWSRRHPVLSRRWLPITGLSEYLRGICAPSLLRFRLRARLVHLGYPWTREIRRGPSLGARDFFETAAS